MYVSKLLSDTYEGAKRKEKRAENTSDLATDDDCSTQRKRKPPQRLLSSDDENCITAQTTIRDEIMREEATCSQPHCSKFVRPPAPPVIASQKFNLPPTQLLGHS